MSRCSNLPINANFFLEQKSKKQMEESDTSKLFGVAICVSKDGASFNKYIFPPIKHWAKTNMCVCVFAAFFFDSSDKCEWKCIAVFFRFRIVWIGRELGISSFNWKLPTISKVFWHDFIIKFKGQSFHIVSSYFNVSKFEINLSILFCFIFSRRTKWGW